MKGFFLLALSLFLIACGYHFESARPSRYIYVPYVEGDDKGFLTSALIRVLAEKGNFQLSSCHADLMLKVCLFEPDEVNVGFIYAGDQDSNLKRVISSNEARLTLHAKVTLCDSAGCCVLGPFDVSSSLSYDFEPDLISKFPQHYFSLGQLEMHTLAQNAAFPPLYYLLAEKIIDYLDHSW